MSERTTLQRNFLPFTPNAKATEIRAIRVKRELGIGPEEPVDPYEVLPAVPARLIDPDEIYTAAPAIARVLFNDDADWSAIGYGRSPATGEELILVNPAHHRHRQRVSVMEEIVHIVSGHPKTELRLDGAGRGVWRREYDREVEDEAYSVGAACMLPYPSLFNAVHYDHESTAVIAERYDVSEAYVSFRIKRAGLSRLYAKHH